MKREDVEEAANDLTNLEQAVRDFIKDFGGYYTAEQIAQKMQDRINWAVIGMVNRGLICVKLDWTLEVRE